MKTVDWQKPYVELGYADPPLDPTSKGADFIEQDGVIFGWSESNYEYEECWWLRPDIKETPLVKHLRKTRAPPPNFCK